MMEQDPLKSAWQNVAAHQRSNTELQAMIQERSHPVLKGIRKQVIFESIFFIILLFVYYDFFDGDKKPFYANVFLVFALLVIILLNMIGYVLTKRPSKGDNIKQSLQHQVSKMKVYAISSIAGRVLYMASLLLFFVVGAPNKIWFFVGITLIFIEQMIRFSKIWIKRLRELKAAISLFP
jgi:cation transport ATPase